MKKQSKQDWKKDFDREFVQDNGTYIEPSFKDPAGDVQRVRNFIEKQITKAYEQGKREGIKYIMGMKNPFKPQKPYKEVELYIGFAICQIRANECLQSLKDKSEKQKTK